LSIWFVLLASVAAGELLISGSDPLERLSGGIVSDKTLHFGAYMLLALVPGLGLQFSSALACVVVSEIVGVALEFAQRMVPGRTCDLYDVLANTAGLLVGTTIVIVLRSRSLRKL
jgi:VanZ family protein